MRKIYKAKRTAKILKNYTRIALNANINFAIMNKYFSFLFERLISFFIFNFGIIYFDIINAKEKIFVFFISLIAFQ
jgi:hypothetical protein